MINSVEMHNNSSKYWVYEPNIFILSLISIYMILSFYEGYINLSIGSITKYYIVVLLFILIFSYKKIRINYLNLLIIIWLLLKIISRLWAPYSLSNVFSYHLFSQLGMVSLYVVLTTVSYSKKSIMKIVDVCMYSSFSMGILALFYSKPYMGNTSRLSLTLFGIENDPNNLAAFYIVGIAISLYYIIYEYKKKFKYIFIIFCNLIALGLTASRAGFMTVFFLVVAIIMLTNTSTSKKSFNTSLKVVLVVSTIMVFYFNISYFLPAESFDRLFNLNYKVDGWSNRNIIWGHAVELFRQKPIWGWGWGYYSGSHNTFLTMLIDVGLIGTTLFTIFLGKIFIRALKTQNFLVILLLIAGIAPALSIDAINKRFFWNAIIISGMLLNCHEMSEKSYDYKIKENKSD